jgi:RNA polymerase-binding transcription factor DksA
MTPLTMETRRRLEERRSAIERSASEAFGLDEAQELQETQAALDRIERGIYGRCEQCGGAIGRQRLLALPTARFCIACATHA